MCSMSIFIKIYEYNQSTVNTTFEKKSINNMGHVFSCVKNKPPKRDRNRCGKCSGSCFPSSTSSAEIMASVNASANCEGGDDVDGSIYCFSDSNDDADDDAFHCGGGGGEDSLLLPPPPMPPKTMSECYNSYPQLHDCPPIYWLNLATSLDRQSRMTKRLEHHELQNRAIRVDAVDGSDPSVIVNLRMQIDPKDVSIIDRLAIDWRVIATTIGHLQMIRQALDESAGGGGDDDVVAAAVFFEDDVDFCHVGRWQRPLAHYLCDLPKDWEIVQLGYQGPHEEELQRLNAAGFLTAGWRIRHYGTFAYAMNGRGMKSLMEKYWNPETLQWRLTPSYYDEQNLHPDHAHYKPLLAADAILYRGMNSYTSTIPWFVYEGMDSLIHPENLDQHRKHLDSVSEWYAAAAVEVVDIAAAEAGILQQQRQQQLPPNFYSSMPDKTQTPTQFVIVIAARNNTDELDACLTSVFAQQYPASSFRVVYGDDVSDDYSLFHLKKWIARNHRFKSRLTMDNQTSRRYPCEMRDLLIRRHTDKESDEVIVLVDGDDRLSDRFVLAYMDSVYRHHHRACDGDDVWITYGGYRSNCAKRRDWGDWSLEEKQQLGGIRKTGKWYAAPLRTFRTSLYHHIDPRDLINTRTGKHWRSATDVAIMIPMLEMAGPVHSHHVARADGAASEQQQQQQRILYIYTIHPGQQYDPDRVAEQRANACSIFAKQSYSPLSRL